MWDDKDVHMMGSLMSFFLAQEYHKAMEDDLRRATFMVVGSRASLHYCTLTACTGLTQVLMKKLKASQNILLPDPRN